MQVVNLQVAEGSDTDEVAPALVEHLCNEALARGAQRLFVRIPDSDPLLPVFRMRGFRQYATQVVGYADRVTKRLAQTPHRARHVRRADGRRLYQLYRKGPPQGVSQLAAPPYRDCAPCHGGRP